MGMSGLKYRLRELLPSLSEQGRACQDREIKKRLYLVKAITTSRRTIKAACDFRGVSRDRYYEWSKRLLREKNISALSSLSRRPHRSPRQTKSETETKIVRLRNKKPFQGPERLSVAMQDEYATNVPPSTIYAVLVRNKLISKEYRARRTKKHLKRYRRPIPGYLQMDFKYVPYLIEGQQCYQLSVVDHCTSWRLIRVYRRKNEESVKEFLDVLNRICPFPIFQIQTDNDAAFTDKYTIGLGARPTGAHPFDEWCKLYGCRHKLIPIGQKELNGKVENTHKYDDEEFFTQTQAMNFAQLENETKKHNTEWNEKRKTKTLGWRTPSELLEEVRATILTLLRCCLPDETIDNQPNVQKTPQLPPKHEKSKDRIIAWMDWEAAQYPKYSLLTVSGMSQIFAGRTPKVQNSGPAKENAYALRTDVKASVQKKAPDS
jgi:transposase InsO family protein